MAALRFVARNSLSKGLRTDVLQAIRRNASTSSVRPANSLRTAVYAGVVAVSTGLLAVYYFDSRSSIHRYVLTPLVRNLLDPEQGHKLAVMALRSGLAARDTQTDDDLLRCEVRSQVAEIRARHQMSNIDLGWHHYHKSSRSGCRVRQARRGYQWYVLTCLINWSVHNAS